MPKIILSRSQVVDVFYRKGIVVEVTADVRDVLRQRDAIAEELPEEIAEIAPKTVPTPEMSSEPIAPKIEPIPTKARPSKKVIESTPTVAPVQAPAQTGYFPDEDDTPDDAPLEVLTGQPG